MTNDRAKAFLEKAGLSCEAEPDWIKQGRKPDFYCSGNAGFWCEVKAFHRPKGSQALGNALNELRRRAADIALPGKGIAYVAGTFNHRDAKTVTNLARRSLSRFSAEDAPERTVALVPNDPVPGQFVRFRISTKEHSAVEFHCAVSKTGTYGSPFGMFPDPPSQKIRLNFSSGETKEVSADKVLDWDDDFRGAIVIQPSDSSFDVIGAMPTGGATRLKTPEQIRSLVADANDQFKNAISYKPAPCLLVIFHDGIAVPDEEIIESALYGDLKYVASKERPHQISCLKFPSPLNSATCETRHTSHAKARRARVSPSARNGARSRARV